MKLEAYHDALRHHGCAISGQPGPHLHHIMGGSTVALLGVRGGRKRSDWLVIPLSQAYHQGEHGIHRLGAQTWEASYGRQVDHVARLGALFGIDPFKLAAAETESRREKRVYKPSSKIVPRRV